VEGTIMPEHRRERRNIAERLSSAGLSLQEDAVRKAILKAFADQGQAPSVRAIQFSGPVPISLFPPP